jgi:hypothetical protein
MLLDPTKADFAWQLDHWARWKRIGCPNTSNAAESIHAKLNAEKRQRRLFVGRLQLVVNYCQKRYDERNSDTRRKQRASNQFLLMLKRPAGQDMLAAEDTGKLEFYTRLNTFRETWTSPLRPPKRKWLFPERSLDGILRSSPIVDVKIKDVDPVKLPNEWLPPYLQKPGKKWRFLPERLKVFLGEPTDETDIDARDRKSHNPDAELAWEIALSIRWMKPQEWENDRKAILHDTLVIGERLRSAGYNMTEVATEVKWRTAAYQVAGIAFPPGVENLGPRLSAPESPGLVNVVKSLAPMSPSPGNPKIQPPVPAEPKRRGRPPRQPRTDL